jgi:hypothetical protein
MNQCGRSYDSESTGPRSSPPGQASSNGGRPLTTKPPMSQRSRFPSLFFLSYSGAGFEPASSRRNDDRIEESSLDAEAVSTATPESLRLRYCDGLDARREIASTATPAAEGLPVLLARCDGPKAGKPAGRAPRPPRGIPEIDPQVCGGQPSQV